MNSYGTITIVKYTLCLSDMLKKMEYDNIIRIHGRSLMYGWHV